MYKTICFSAPINFEHSWEQLENSFQEKLLKENVNFQGSMIELSEIVTPNSAAIKTIDLKKLCCDEEIQIGCKIELEGMETYVEKRILEQYSKNIKSKHVFLLVGPPGWGKTMILKDTAKKLQETHSNKWIAYIDLKLHSEVIEKDDEMLNDFKDLKEIVEYFASHILKLDASNEKFFIDLFENDRVILLFDSIDVITANFRKLVVQLITDLKKSKNKIMIATRPNLVKELKLAFQSATTVNMKPFTMEDRNKLFDKILISHQTQIQKDLIFKNLNEHLLSIENDEPISSPLILNMIAREFQINSSNVFNSFALFEKLSQIIAERSLESSIFSEEYPKIVRFYQQKALELMCHGNKEIKEFMDKFLGLNSNASSEQILQIGLFYEDENGNQKFIHRSFADFFLAKILSEDVIKQNENAEVSLALWKHCLTKPELKITRKILNDAIERIQNATPTSQAMGILTADLQKDSDVLVRLASERCINLLNFVNKSPYSRGER